MSSSSGFSSGRAFGLLATLFLAAPSVAPAAPAYPLKLSQFTSLVGDVNEAKYSPDGTRIVFLGALDKAYTLELYRAQGQSNLLRSVINNPYLHQIRPFRANYWHPWIV